MQKSEVKSKSVRRPLRDVVNNVGGGRSSRPMTDATKKFSEKDKFDRPRAQEEEEKEEEEILLIQSELSYILLKVTAPLGIRLICIISFMFLLSFLGCIRQKPSFRFEIQ